MGREGGYKTPEWPVAVTNCKKVRRANAKSQRSGVRRINGGGATGWMINPCLQGYTLQLYLCRVGQREGGGTWTDHHLGPHYSTEAPSSASDFHPRLSVALTSQRNHGYANAALRMWRSRQKCISPTAFFKEGMMPNPLF